MTTDSEFKIEMKTYSVRCAMCSGHKPLYKHPDHDNTDKENKVMFCRKCMFKVKDGQTYPLSCSRETQGFKHFERVRI